MELPVGSHVVHLAGTNVLIKSVIRLTKLAFQEGKVLYDGRTVSNVGVAHAGRLSFILDSFHVLDDVVVENVARVFDQAMQLSVASLGVDGYTLVFSRKFGEICRDLIVGSNCNLIGSEVIVQLGYLWCINVKSCSCLFPWVNN